MSHQLDYQIPEVGERGPRTAMWVVVLRCVSGALTGLGLAYAYLAYDAYLGAKADSAVWTSVAELACERRLVWAGLQGVVFLASLAVPKRRS